MTFTITSKYGFNEHSKKEELLHMHFTPWGENLNDASNLDVDDNLEILQLQYRDALSTAMQKHVRQDLSDPTVQNQKNARHFCAANETTLLARRIWRKDAEP